jgi:16S rRNA (cytosine967-C5)-methyltransferase
VNTDNGKKPGSSHHNIRAVAAIIINQLMHHRGNLETLLHKHGQHIARKDLPLLKAMCYTTCRHFFSLSTRVNHLLEKPLRDRDQDILALLLVGACQLRHMHLPAHAAVNETVTATKALDKRWARGLVNAILRKIQRQLDDAETDSEDEHSEHPRWLEEALRSSWPDYLEAIFEANNQQAPMTLRINKQKTSIEEYLPLLEQAGLRFSKGKISAEALYLEAPTDVSALPGFDAGLVSVQDEAAQLCAGLLEVREGMSVLDACAAPGGKTCHLLEIHPGLDLTALEIDEHRSRRINQNLERLGLEANVINANAANPAAWNSRNKLFDRILLDAPCSATGVIRRHPDIKMLRRAEDIPDLQKQQSQLLEQLWQVLEPGGRLLYTTCSVLPAENEEVVASFLAKADDAINVPIEAGWGLALKNGRQLLPAVSGTDGFYFSLLEKAG